MSTPATCDFYIFCSVIYDSWRVDKEQLKDPSALLSPLWKLDDEWNLILQGAWEAWVSQHGKFTMWFKNSPSLSELWGEHAIWGRGVPAEMMSLWPVRGDQLPPDLSPPLSSPLTGSCESLSSERHQVCWPPWKAPSHQEEVCCSWRGYTYIHCIVFHWTGVSKHHRYCVLSVNTFIFNNILFQKILF